MTTGDTNSGRAGQAGIPVVRIFVSSPGDVAEERAVTLSVLRRLQGWFQGRLLLVPILWEQEPLLASAGFQQEIDRRAAPRATDVALFILWSRLGTPLSKDFVLEDGRRPTGTEWEFEDAAKGHAERGAPDILVYRKSEAPKAALDQADDALGERLQQFRSVTAFFERHFRNSTDFSFRGSYHKFPDAARFGLLLEAHLTKLLTERLTGAQSVATWHGSPFRGLEAFEPEHASVFFGRTRAIQEVRQALALQARAGRAFVLILGPSGNGKSSLARAGLLPMLDAPWVVEEGLEGGLCRRAMMTPGGARTPLEALVLALLAPGALPDLKDHGSASELAALFAKSPEAAVSDVRASLRRAAEAAAGKGGDGPPPPARLVLLVDQMEEMFTREGVSDADRDAFVRVLDALARGGDAWVLATLRSDHYPAFARSSLLMALKEGGGQYDLGLPEASETEQIIRGPAQVAGLRYETDAASGRRLDEALLSDAMKGPDALPLLEYALTQLEERKRGDLLPFEAYQAMGGLEGAIRQRAEQTWSALTEGEQKAFPTVLRALVEVGEGGAEAATRRRTPYEEVTRTPAAKGLVDAFVGARLLVAEGEGAGAAVKVAHEALLRAWPRAADRIDAEAELLRIRSRLRTQAARWKQEGRRADLLLPTGKPLEEARLLTTAGFDLTAVEAEYVAASEARARRVRLLRRIAVSVIAGLGLVAAVLAIYATGKQREAQESAHEAADALDSVLRLADAKKVRDLEDEAAALSPLQVDLAERTGEWTKRAATLLESLPDHVAALERLRKEALAPGPPWKFAAGALDWQHQVLGDLVGRLRRLGDPAEVIPIRMERLRHFAASVKDAQWGPTVERVAGNPRYAGLRFVPQVGLVPLGPDPDSGLEEFAHVASGSVPTRDPATKRLAYDDNSAIVLVLVPGGKFWMGAQKEDPTKPNHDPNAESNEAPVREVTLSAFFLAKHECTQAQWKVLAGGEAPSHFQEGTEAPRRAVEQVSWNDCKRWLPEAGLALPTEAQWEYACRAGSATRYFFGDDETALKAYAWYAVNSEAKVHPVGGLKPNAWGLYDMHGNVGEWCEDLLYGDYTSATDAPIRNPVRATSRRFGPDARVIRGQDWFHPAAYMGSAVRRADDPGERRGEVGFRPARAVAAN